MDHFVFLMFLSHTFYKIYYIFILNYFEIFLVYNTINNGLSRKYLTSISTSHAKGAPFYSHPFPTASVAALLFIFKRFFWKTQNNDFRDRILDILCINPIVSSI